MIQDEEPDGDIEQTEAYHHQAHHGTRAEGHLETLVERVAGCIGRAGRSIGSGLHTEETSQAGEETTGEEGKRHPFVLCMEHVGHEGKDDGQHDEHDEYHLVLLFQVGHGSLAHILSNFNHSRCSLALLHHLREEEPCHSQCAHRSDGNNPKDSRNHSDKNLSFIMNKSIMAYPQKRKSNCTSTKL